LDGHAVIQENGPTSIRIQVCKPYQGTSKERICIIVLLTNAIFLAQNALSDNAKGRPRNAKERLALKLCPLSGKTAFLGIALWKDRILKREKKPRPRNARSPPRPPPRPKPGTYCHASP
jgi:hypothetical protein